MAGKAHGRFPTGWLGVDGRQRSVAGHFPGLRSAAPKLVRGATLCRGPAEPILLYRAWRDVLGTDPDYPAQQIGDCVSFGHGHANDLVQCIEIALGEPSEYRETDTEFLYAASREVAGLLGLEDGSYGAAAVKAMTDIGLVSREMLGADGAYSGRRASEWGRVGVPSELKARAAAYRIGGGALVATWDELLAALSHGYPVTICTRQGFGLERDAQGFCAAEGTWGHCMFIAGARFDRPGACVVQSWGPTTPSGPRALGQPSFSFWVDRPVVERILAEGDSWAISRAPEFALRELPGHWSYDRAA
jgi:hypothetical protein